MKTYFHITCLSILGLSTFSDKAPGQTFSSQIRSEFLYAQCSECLQVPAASRDSKNAVPDTLAPPISNPLVLTLKSSGGQLPNIGIPIIIDALVLNDTASPVLIVGRKQRRLPGTSDYQILGYFRPQLQLPNSSTVLSRLQTFSFYEGMTPETQPGEELLFDVSVFDGKSQQLIQQVFTRITPAGTFDNVRTQYHADGVTWTPRTETLRIQGEFPVGQSVWLTIGDPRSCVIPPVPVAVVSPHEVTVSHFGVSCPHNFSIAMDVNVFIPSAQESWTFPGAVWFTGLQ